MPKTEPKSLNLFEGPQTQTIQLQIFILKLTDVGTPEGEVWHHKAFDCCKLLGFPGSFGRMVCKSVCQTYSNDSFFFADVQNLSDIREQIDCFVCHVLWRRIHGQFSFQELQQTSFFRHSVLDRRIKLRFYKRYKRIITE